MSRKPKTAAEAADVAQDVRNAFKGDPDALLAALIAQQAEELDDEDLARQERAIRRLRKRKSYAKRLEDGFAMMNGEYPEEDGE